MRIEYGDNNTDEFEQNFEIKEDPIAKYFIYGLIGVFILIALFSIRKEKRNIKKPKKSKQCLKYLRFDFAKKVPILLYLLNRRDLFKAERE